MSNLAWLTPVLIAAVIVFFVDLVCSFATSSNRVLNAVVQAVLFAIVAGLITAYFTVSEVSIAPVTP
ncbi:MAG: hypothetical protein R3D30_07850 [Hyphomicrobiales bacterium]